MIEVGDIIQVGKSDYALGKVLEIFPKGHDGRKFKSIKCEWSRDGMFGVFSLIKEFKYSDCKKVKSND